MRLLLKSCFFCPQQETNHNTMSLVLKASENQHT